MAALVLLAGGLFEAECFAQSKSATHATKRYELPVSVTWQGQELAAGVERLADLQQIAIWIDRRVDPSTAVDLAENNQPLIDVLRRLGEPHGWSASPWDGIVYFGPKQTADELATLSAIARQQAAKTPPTARNAWLKSEAWSFPRLSQPRELLLALAASAGASVQNAELVPLDLWPARSLPPMPLVDRIVLLLSGFDLTCDLSSDGVRLIIAPIKRPVRISREFTLPAGREAEIEQLLRSMPAARIERRGQRLAVSARIEELEQIAAAIRGQRTAEKTSPPLNEREPVSLEDQRFTLRVENKPVGPVVDQLARQLGLQVTWDEAGARPMHGALVSCAVREADVDALFKAILSPAHLDFQRDGRRVTIRAAN